MPFGIGSSKKPKDKGNVIQPGKYLLYATAYHWSSFSILKINVKNCSIPPGGHLNTPPPPSPVFQLLCSEMFLWPGVLIQTEWESKREASSFSRRPMNMHSLFPPILEYTDNSDPRERGCTKYKRNEKDLKWNWLAFYSEPNNRVLYSILSLVFVFIFVCLSSMSLCLSCLYVFVREWLVAGKFTWVKHPSSWSICGHRSYLRFFQPPPPSYTDLITPATDLLS